MSQGSYSGIVTFSRKTRFPKFPQFLKRRLYVYHIFHFFCKFSNPSTRAEDLLAYELENILKKMKKVINIQTISKLGKFRDSRRESYSSEKNFSIDHLFYKISCSLNKQKISIDLNVYGMHVIISINI